MSASRYGALMLMEAICSTAMSHEEGCDCLTCRAAEGKPDAIAGLMAEVDSAMYPKGGKS